MAASPIFPGTPKNFGAIFTSTDTTTAKALVTAGANGSIVDVLNIIGTHTTDYFVILQLYNGTTAYDLNEVPIPDGAGTNGVDKPVNGLNCFDTPALGNREDRAIYLQTGWSLRAKLKTGLPGGPAITVAGCYGDF